MNKFLFLICIPFLLCAQSEQESAAEQARKRKEKGQPPIEQVAPQPPQKTPQEIEMELARAEIQFMKAQQMFNPWYTGPLITPSASMMPPAEFNIQPYLFVTDKYGAYNEDRHEVGFPHSLIQLQGSATLQSGITDSMDVLLGVSGFGNWQNGHQGGGFGDMFTTVGFLICKETRSVPKFKFTVSESYPTGKFEHLDTTGLDSTGAGAYGTTFGLAMGKLFLYTTQHPLNTRLFIGYQVWTDVHVHSFNTYGGGHGTEGVVRPGNVFTADLGAELSITQNWVAAIDVVYTASGKTNFHGKPGVTTTGAPATVGGGSSDNLSIAPAIEYNWNSNLGVIFGGWFSVYGRNSTAFGSGIISVTYTFP